MKGSTLACLRTCGFIRSCERARGSGSASRSSAQNPCQDWSGYGLYYPHHARAVVAAGGGHHPWPQKQVASARTSPAKPLPQQPTGVLAPLPPPWSSWTSAPSGEGRLGNAILQDSKSEGQDSQCGNHPTAEMIFKRCWEAAMPGVPCSHTSTLLSPSLFAINTGNTSRPLPQVCCSKSHSSDQ